MAPPSHDPRVQVFDLVQRHGWNATSFQTLGAGFEYWFDGPDACVAYVPVGGAWVVAGGPIAPLSRTAAVVARFVSHARSQRRRVCFFGVEADFASDAVCAQLPIGEQPVWDPRAWGATLAASRSLREQLRRARAKGVTIRRLAAEELVGRLRAEVDLLLQRWLATRRIAPMGFLLDVDPFAFAPWRRYAVAQREGHAIGLLVASPICARGGWLFEHLLRMPGAPNGTSELLVDAGMRAVADEGSTYVTLGLAPLSGGVPPWLHTAATCARGLYDFEGIRAFKSRLHPHTWEPVALAYPDGTWAATAVYDTLAAFARGAVVQFAGRSLRHLARGRQSAAPSQIPGSHA